MNSSFHQAEAVAALGQMPHRLLAEAWRLTGTDGAGVLSPARQGELLQHIAHQADQLFERLKAQQQQIQCSFGALSAAATNLLSSGTGSAADPYWPFLGPLLGLTPTPLRQQPQLDALGRALRDFQSAQLDYLGLLQEMARDGIDEFGRRLEQHHGQHLPPRALYEVWLEAGELAYERVLNSDRYAQAFAALTNAHSALLERAQQAYDSAAGLLDLPTRTEFLQTQQRLQELRRQARAWQSETLRVEALQAELEALRAEVAVLRETADRGDRGQRAS